MKRIWASATELARKFEEHPLVAEVRHPSLPSRPQHERAKRLMSCFGSVLAVRSVSRLRAAEELGRFVRVWLPMTSPGGIESDFGRRRHFPTEAVAVPGGLLRVSVSIEDVKDLWRDPDAALKGVHQ